MTSIALNNLWTFIQSIGLSNSNKQWLADKLIESKTNNREIAAEAEDVLMATFPCTFTEEEWKEELRLSMQEGEATDDEVNEYYKKWNLAL